MSDAMSDDFYARRNAAEAFGTIDPPRRRFWWERSGGLRWPFAMAWKLYRWAVYRK